MICSVVRGAGIVGALPDPLPILDMDRTILLHQAKASTGKHDAEIVLIGDSSCLMDISAAGLAEQLGRKVLNLGTLSYLDITDFALILEHYFASDNVPPEMVVLVVHPDWLRRFESEPYHANVLDAFYSGREKCFGGDSFSKFTCLAGIETFRARVLAKVVPAPLDGAARDYYGFTADLWNVLERSGGSAVDPGRFDPDAPQGNAEFRISTTLARDGRSLKDVLPDGVRLAVALSPTPGRIVGNGFRPRWESLLSDLAEVTDADVVLGDLPESMSDDRFASRTHIAEHAINDYTERVADALRSRLR